VVDSVEALRPALLGLLEELNLPSSNELVVQLLGYLTLLQRWNATYNLTAVRELRSMLTQHLADCLAVIPDLRQADANRRIHRLLDTGSGGGLPGAVIAMLMPHVHVTCVDAVGKKAAFVQQVASTLELPNLNSRHGRIEQLQLEPFDLVTSRAFSSLADFVSLTRAQLGAGGSWLAMKGKIPTEEMSALPADIEVFHVEQLKVPGLNAERCLIWMRPGGQGDSVRSL
jgi:16S rRNA (guanine527-N7)-methyltransferase